MERRGALPFFHYAYGEERLLNYDFTRTHFSYDAFEGSFSSADADFPGAARQVVDPRTVEVFATHRTNVTLSLLDDDHQLLASLPRMWTGVEDFLGLLD